MQLLDGKSLSIKIKKELKEKVKKLEKYHIIPHLAVILVGDNPASITYVNNKRKACELCGIKSSFYHLDTNTTQEELLKLIKDLNDDNTLDGILVQLPLPTHINKDIILQSIDSLKDVDGFHPFNIGLLELGLKDGFIPCTPLGIIELLNHYNISVDGLNAVMIGASNIVGRPMTSMLLNLGATVSICHIKTKDLSLYTKSADLIIIATGCPGLLKADMIKEGAIIIDVGINKINGKIIGDVDFDNVSKKSSYISPVPGGVGPMTIAMLLSNTIKSAYKRLKA